MAIENKENNVTPTQIIKNINESFNYESNETQKINVVEKSFDLNISESEKQKMKFESKKAKRLRLDPTSGAADVVEMQQKQKEKII